MTSNDSVLTRKNAPSPVRSTTTSKRSPSSPSRRALATFMFVFDDEHAHEDSLTAWDLRGHRHTVLTAERSE